MNKFFLSFLTALLISGCVFAQSPQSFSYQTVIRDLNYNVLSNQTIVLRLSILEDDPQGETVYQEKHVITTSQIGLVNLILAKEM